ncbi:MAG TPA: glutamate 5-kinase [Propionibacteriaceae bacterium]|nr:glutamate 5-kinase [Propionibacteriaceae bacterium]
MTTTRAQVGRAHRLVVKVGSSSLTTASGGLDPDRVKALVDAIAEVRAQGRQVVLISSGAIAAGLAPLGFKRRPRDLAAQQAAASVGQGLLMRHYTEMFAEYDTRVGQVLLTVDDVTRESNYKNALRTLSRLLRLGAIPIVNENDTVATHEIRFGDNDRLAALVAQLVRADALVLLSDVDALYTAHPDDPTSTRIEQVDDVASLEVDTSRLGSSGVGSGGMTSKLQAAHIAASAGIPVLLAGAEQAAEAMAGGQVGTAFAPVGKRRSRRLLWLAHASNARGQLVLDDGAVRAVLERKASLLAAGITDVVGAFDAGDPVELVNTGGRVVARGLVAFSSEELPAMLGRNSHELAESLGDAYEREVVHRDALVVVAKRKAPTSAPEYTL